jgi:oxalate decarboxylase/phosphoglucose isomerase-like protein (cupin superfamily)
MMSDIEAKASQRLWTKRFTYDLWMEAQGIPIHRGYYIQDLRTAELAWWKARDCNAAFIQLVGQEGVTSTRIIEIPPGKTLTMPKAAFDEIAYSLNGNGLTTIENAGGGKSQFEWQPHSMFTMPRHRAYQMTNADGSKPARVLFFNYLPMAMSAVPDADWYFDNPFQAGETIAPEFYAEAKMVKPSDAGDAYLGKRVYWFGNFFPNMQAWDRMDDNSHRGGGGSTSVYCQFPDTELSAHMSEFGARTYKKAHRHGPGRAIIIPVGEGYSIMWEEGKEKVIVPWHECSMFVPPNRWFHQHFNVGDKPARYLAMHPPMQFHGHAEKVTDRAKDQIEYVDEAPEIRERFEGELAKRGLSSALSPSVYSVRDFDWSKFAENVHGKQTSA